MRKVFVQFYGKYPNGSAPANYIKQFVKAISYAGYHVYLLTDIDSSDSDISEMENISNLNVISIVPSNDSKVAETQRKQGLCIERLRLMVENDLRQDDLVIVYDIYNTFFWDYFLEQKKLLKYRICACVLEMFSGMEVPKPKGREIRNDLVNNFFVKLDGVISISDFIDIYYSQKGVKTYKFPPLTDTSFLIPSIKRHTKRRFVLFGNKDSYKNVLYSINKLPPGLLSECEFHVWGFTDKSFYYEIKDLFSENFSQLFVIHEWMKYQELITLLKEMDYLIIARDICQRTLANFPSKVPECMALGIIPIVSEVGDYTKYYLKNLDNCLYIHGDGIDEIAKSIEKAILMDGTLLEQISERARKTAEDRFDYRVWKSQIIDMIEDDSYRGKINEI